MPSNIDVRIFSLKTDQVGYYSMSKKQFEKYKKLKLAELEARRAVDNYLDSLLKKTA